MLGLLKMKILHLWQSPVYVKNYLFFAIFSLNLIAVSASFAQEIETVTIEPKAIAQQISRTGKLAFKRTLNLSFKTSGYLKELNIDEGEKFSKGQVLAQLDTFELKAEKNASYAHLLQAKREVKRIKALINKNLSSQQALDEAMTLVETTRANHKVAEYNLNKAQLIAPFDGVVLKRFTELGELQNPNQTALQLAASENNLVVKVALTASEVKAISLNQQVPVDLAELNAVLGTVTKVPVIADQSSNLFTIEIMLTDFSATQLVVGQFASISTEVVTDNFAYQLPISALNSVDNQGRALITAKELNAEGAFQQQAYNIESLSNQYIYLSAKQNAAPLTVVTIGWQQLIKKLSSIEVN